MGLRPVLVDPVRRTDYSSANWTGELSLAIFGGYGQFAELSLALSNNNNVRHACARYYNVAVLRYLENRPGRLLGDGHFVDLAVHF